MLSSILPFIVLILVVVFIHEYGHYYFAKKNDRNNNDCDTNDGKILAGNKIPINMDFEKSGLGNNNNPANKPIIIEIYAFFSLIFLS